MKTYSRRKFLKTAAATAAGITIVPNTILGKAWGHTAPSDKLNIAGIGIGGMGRRKPGEHEYGKHRSFMRCGLGLCSQDVQRLSEGRTVQGLACDV